MASDPQEHVKIWLESLPSEKIKCADQPAVVEAGFGAGPGCVAGKIEKFESPVSLEDGLHWISSYSHVLKAAHLRLVDGSILWFDRWGFTRRDDGKQPAPRPGVVVIL